LRFIYIFVDTQRRVFLATLTQFASNDCAALEASTEDLEVYLSGDETMKSKSLSGPRICVCCGERITRRSENPNICVSCFAFAGVTEEVQQPLPKSAANLNWTKSKPPPAAKIRRCTTRRS
jgi:hypothetical protein